MSFTTKTASKYKYQTAIETTEQNTSKRVNAKESVLQNVCKYLSFFLMLKWLQSNKSKEWNEGYY